MEVYVARQPILDRRMNVSGYELLYRRSTNNFYEGLSDNQATAELINNAFFTMQLNDLTSGTRAFINFSHDMLLKEIPLLLPKQSIVVEILERTEISESLINICKKLRRRGYIIALDDFAFTSNFEPLLEIAHIIKIEFPNVSYEKQNDLIKKYKHKVRFLAEKVETREEYQLARQMGYDYFQGYFFSKPAIVKGNEIGILNANLLRITNELKQNEPEYRKISQIIEMDLGLSYKLLRVANSAFFASKNKITSIRSALVRLGLIEIEKWVYLMLLKDVQSVENSELIKNCLIRAKIMEFLAVEKGIKYKQVDYFMAGMFSSIDVLLSRSMQEVLDEITLSADVKDALTGTENEIRQALDLILNYEMLDWDKIDVRAISPTMTVEKFTNMYIEALKWVININY